MSKKYSAVFFMNGRIVCYKNEDFDKAVEAGKELLIVCGGWSGGYAYATGAEKTVDYEGNDCYEVYGYEVKDQEFSEDDFKKFYKIIFSDGIRVYMKTGSEATYYSSGTFSDWDSNAESYYRHYHRDIAQSHLDELRHEVDSEVTKSCILRMKDGKDLWESISGYYPFFESKEGKKNEN